MRQAGTAAREFAREFEWRARDVGMAEEDAKVHLVSVLNQDTLARLDAYVTMRGGDKDGPPGNRPGQIAPRPLCLDAGILEVR